jgi:two-component system OmpR family sensor kinase
MATSSTRRSVVRRVLALTALWAIGLSLALAALAIWQYWRVSMRALDTRITADADALARHIVVTDGVVEVEVTGDLRLAASEGASYYGIYDAQGRLLDGDAPPLPPSDIVQTGTWTVDGHREHRLEVAPTSQDAASTPLAIVRVGQPLAPIRADVGRLATSLFIASLIAVLLAAPLAVWLRRELGRSIQQIDRTARTLAPGQPARIDLATVDAEFVGVGERLNAAFDRLEQGLVRERQLTADASHELRTPVTTIIAESEWALARPRSDEEYRHALEVCARQGGRLKSLVESLLTLARIESGSEPRAYEPVELRAVVHEVILDLARLAGERHVVLRCDGDGTAIGDRLQVGILVMNLLSNAVRYNRDGGAVTVTLSDVEAGEDGQARARIVVSDTGPGLDAAVVHRVFDRFWRAAPSRSSREGGTGLGLAIGKAIVDAHGGRIDLRTGPDGTTFTVDLPGGVRSPSRRLRGQVSETPTAGSGPADPLDG